MDSLELNSNQKELLIQASSQVETSGYSVWLWAIFFAITLLIAVLFTISRKKNKEKLMLGDLSEAHLRKIKKSKVDMDNLMKSINQSKELYKLLSSKCHPDRFINSEKHAHAELIFQEITRNQRNYEQLLALKEKAVNELNINF